MTDRFDLEEQIHRCWSVTDDVYEVYSAVMDKEMSTDDIANALLGIRTLYQLKFERLWETFEACLREGRFTSDIVVTPTEQE